MRRVGLISVVAAAAVVLLGVPVAHAHPLGNFSINVSHNLTFEPGGVVDRAIVDVAEIPTAQAQSAIDADGNGTVTADERDAHAQAECRALAAATTLAADSVTVPVTAVQWSFMLQEGQAGLPTGRLECRLEATLDLSRSTTVTLSNDFANDRVGWHEINAIGSGVQLVDSPIPAVSPTEELRTYPEGVLASPLDVRTVTVTVAPGAGDSNAAVDETTSTAAEDSVFRGGPLSHVVDGVTDTFDGLVGTRDLTLGVGLAAVALAMVLGASHALLPGHGKTVMAAYIAGRQGSSRDAVTVGATVTATHTGGVLVLGLALTASSSLAGESVLGWLGLASGLLIATLGAGLLWNALRHRPTGHGHRHGLGHGHHHHGHHHHGTEHGHRSGTTRLDHERSRPRRVQVSARQSERSAMGHTLPALVSAPVGTSIVTRAARRERTSVSVVRRSASPRVTPAAPVMIRPDRQMPDREVSRRGLVAMGIAGGLVPSPSALIVLLSAIALGRTVFGVVLVIGYGLGMAATLTLAGLLLVRVRDRLERRARVGRGRLSAVARRWGKVMPYATATLVLVVGLGIAIRGVDGIAT